MKRILTIILLGGFFLTTSAQEAIFRKYEDTKGVTTIFISKNMLRLIPNVKAGDKDLTRLAPKLDRINILTCSRPTLVPVIRKEAVAIYKREKYEEAMRVNDSGDHVVIYLLELKGGKNEFALLSEDSDGELSIINIAGTITLKDIQSITK
ncbi:MAG: DUF4252 domain-containing protein [Prevotella sp.]|nr:DUF4252 domain-containing protein [Prevotella sp.]